MDLNRARKLFSNLKPVFDVMGGDLETACLEEGIPPDMIHVLMSEWADSESLEEKIITLLPDDDSIKKKISDRLMQKFENAHDEQGNHIINKKR